MIFTKACRIRDYPLTLAVDPTRNGRTTDTLELYYNCICRFCTTCAVQKRHGVNGDETK